MECQIAELEKYINFKTKSFAVYNEDSFLNFILTIVSLAELAMNNNTHCPWLIENKINLRRNSYELDKHLQNMLLLAKENADAYVIECGSAHYYKTEIVINGNLFIHCCQKFNRESKYNQNYLEMNSDKTKLGFCCFEYRLTENKKAIDCFELVIPLPNDREEYRVNLTELLNHTRSLVKKCKLSIVEYLNRIVEKKTLEAK